MFPGNLHRGNLAEHWVSLDGLVRDAGNPVRKVWECKFQNEVLTCTQDGNVDLVDAIFMTILRVS